MYALDLSLLSLLVRVLKHLSLQPVKDISIPPLLYLHPPIRLLTRTHNLNTIVSGGFCSNVQMLYRRMPPGTTLRTSSPVYVLALPALLPLLIMSVQAEPSHRRRLSCAQPKCRGQYND
jgi:hypothetical protein